MVNGTQKRPEIFLPRCDQGKRSKRRRSLGIHRTECHICHKRFETTSKVVTHALSHTGERPFKCNQCDYSGTTKSALKSHLDIHSKTRGVQCNICPKTFKSKKRMSEHKRRYHYGIGKFKCSLCTVTSK